MPLKDKYRWGRDWMRSTTPCFPPTSHVSGTERVSRCVGVRTGLGQDGVLAVEDVWLS